MKILFFFLASPSYFTATHNTTTHLHNQAIPCHWKPRPLNTEFTVKLIHQSIKSVYYSTKSIKSVNLHNKINNFSIKISKLQWTEHRPSANKISKAWWTWHRPSANKIGKAWWQWWRMEICSRMNLIGHWCFIHRKRERELGLVEGESVSEEERWV